MVPSAIVRLVVVGTIDASDTVDGTGVAGVVTVVMFLRVVGVAECGRVDLVE